MSGIYNIVIEDGVTSIRNCTFSGCTGLTAVTIPDSVIEIGDSAFFGCASLTSVIIPDGVTKIGENAFNRCSNLTSVTIPDSVTILGGYTFSKCTSLTSITILNPDCEIYDSNDTICNRADSGNCYYTGTISGYSGSTAEAYAQKYGRTFVSLDAEPSILSTGDLDGDNNVTASDAQKF